MLLAWSTGKEVKLAGNTSFECKIPVDAGENLQLSIIA